MQLRGKKSKQELLKAKLYAKKVELRGMELPLLEKAEVLTWLQRLAAIQEFESTGQSAMLKAEADELKVTEEELVVILRKRLFAIGNPLLPVFVNDIKEQMKKGKKNAAKKRKVR